MKKLTLGDVCKKASSNIAQKDLLARTGKYPIFGASGFIKNVDFYHQNEEYIAVVKDGSGIGRTMLLPAYSSVIGTMQYLIPTKKIDIDICYLYYAIVHMNLSKYYSGSAIPHIYFRDYKTEPINIHNIEKQNKISKELSLIDKLIGLKKEQLLKLDNLIKSRFVEMFGDPVRNEKCWPIVTLNEVAEIRIGPFGSLLHKEDYIKGGHALINPSHIIDGKIYIDANLTLSPEKYKELKAYHLEIGDVVLGRRGEMGRCAVVCSSGLLCGTGSIIIRPNKNMAAYFLQTILSSLTYKKIIADKAVGVTMKNLNVPIVSSLPVPLLPLNLQKKFIAILQQVDKSKLAVKQSLEKLEILKKSLMQEYFG